MGCITQQYIRESDKGEEEEGGIRGVCERLIFCQQQSNLLPGPVFAGGANVFKSHNYLDCQRGAFTAFKCRTLCKRGLTHHC